MILSRAISRQAYIRPPQTGVYDSTLEYSSDFLLFGEPAIKKTANNSDSIKFRLCKGKYFPGSLSTEGNGTVEFWIYSTGLNSLNKFIFSSGNFSNEPRLNARSGSPAGFSLRVNYTDTVRETSIGRYPLNQWVHIAFTLEDNLWATLWINGNRVSTAGNGTAQFNFIDSGLWRLGNNDEATPYYLREFRISTNVRYDRNEATYDVPTGPFVNDEDTYMLFHLDGDDENTAGIPQLIDDVSVPEPTPDIESFIMEVNTAGGGTSNTNQFILPTTGSGYDFTVDWGDGVTETYSGSPGNITHTYPSSGIYDISISGDFPRIFFNNANDRNKLNKVKQWGSIQWSSFENAFTNCNILQITAADAPNLSNVTSMRSAFQACNSPNLSTGHNFNAWDTSNITDMGLMFISALSFNAPLGNWDVSNVNNMDFMFRFTFFNQDISTWCVEQFASEPSNFKSDTLSPENEPKWGEPCIDPDALAFLEAAEITDETTTTAINNLVVGLKAQNLWNKMFAIYPFVGGTATTHKWNLKDPRDLDAAYRITFTGGWTHLQETGITPNGINTAGNTYYVGDSAVDNDFALSYWTQTTTMESNDPGRHTFGALGIGVTGTRAIIINRTNLNWTSNLGQDASFANQNFANVGQKGLLIGSRVSQTSNKVYKDGVLLATNTTSNTTNWPGTIPVHFGEPRQGIFTFQNCIFATISTGLTDTDSSNLYNVSNAFQTELGRQV